MAATYIFLTLLLLQAFNAQHSNEPTHIIRFVSHRNITAGDKLIMQQYKKYQTSLHTGAVLASGSDTTAIIAPRNLTTISFGDNFNAVTGTFHSSFIEHLQSHPDIEYVEKNQIYRATRRRPLYHRRMRRALTSQNNPKNWGLARLSNKKKDGANQYTYESSAGEGVQVFILDSGINVDHKEFGGRAILDANFVQDEPEDDLGGHGTHVAGIIGGSTFGVSKNAELRSVKILDKNGDGSTVNLLQALEHVGKYAKKGKSVINLSLSGPKSKLVNDALSSTTKEYNIPIFVSAGNTADDSCNYSPSDNPDVFAVGATNRDDKVSLFSATGSCVRLYAPGQDIQSAWIGSQENSMILDGTSMANPHVVGIAALLMARKSYKSPNDLYTALTDIAIKDELEFYDTMLQSFTIPQDVVEQQSGLIAVIRESLSVWGDSYDLGSFLNDVYDRVKKSTHDAWIFDSYWWRDIQAVTEDDFVFTLDNIKQTAAEPPIGVRVEMIKDEMMELRPVIPVKFNLPIVPYESQNLDKLHQRYEADPSMIFYNNTYIPAANVCDKVHQYLTEDSCKRIDLEDAARVKHVIESTMALVHARSKSCNETSQNSNPVSDGQNINHNVDSMNIDNDETKICGDYTLLACLMCLNGYRRSSRQQWRFYVKQLSDETHKWQVHYNDGHGEQVATIAGDQALDDIRGQRQHQEIHLNGGTAGSLRDTENYAPVYLVYVNAYLMSARHKVIKLIDEERQQVLGKRKVITDEDYFSDDDNDEDLGDGEVCKHCFIGLDVPQNKLFICDACNQHVHQFCEDPRIKDEEINIDPWVCRACQAAGRQPIIQNGNTEATLSSTPSANAYSVGEPASKRLNLQ